MVESPRADLLGLRRIGPAYEQIQTQLRAEILLGRLGNGARLPTEADLAAAFGVSRATVREALRGLSAEGLIETSKGPTGGSFVSMPSFDRVAARLRSGMSLLARSGDLSLEDLTEIRLFLEVPACRAAAQRRTDEDIAALRASAPTSDKEPNDDPQTSFERARDFHDLVVDAAHNPLLTLATEPMFTVTQTRLDRTRLTRKFHLTSNAHHDAIVEAIVAGDGDRAAEIMDKHLKFVRLAYDKAWIPLEDLYK